MEKVIIDCDNTIGKPFAEIDDGLTILYLLGRKDIELLGITNCYANASLKEVEYWTDRFLHDIDRLDILRFSGKPFSGQNSTEWFLKHWGHHFIDEKKSQNTPSDAALFLVNQATKHPGSITILALGSMSNLLEAWELDNNFFKKIKKILLMGGVEPGTVLREHECIELNLACNPAAAYKVLHNNDCPVVVMNAKTCFDAPFGYEDMNRISFWPERRKQMIREWIGVFQGVFYLWDLLPAVYLSYLELFDSQKIKIASTIQDLEKGLLIRGAVGSEILMPEHILNPELFMQILRDAWESEWQSEKNGWIEIVQNS